MTLPKPCRWHRNPRFSFKNELQCLIESQFSFQSWLIPFEDFSQLSCFPIDFFSKCSVRLYLLNSFLNTSVVYESLAHVWAAQRRGKFADGAGAGGDWCPLGWSGRQRDLDLLETRTSRNLVELNKGACWVLLPRRKNHPHQDMMGTDWLESR